MGTFVQRFAAITRDYPYHSSIVNFSRAIEGQALTKQRVGFYFRKLVDKEDYAKEDSREIIEWANTKTQKPLPRLSHILAEKHQKHTQNAQPRNRRTHPHSALRFA